MRTSNAAVLLVAAAAASVCSQCASAHSMRPSWTTKICVRGGKADSNSRSRGQSGSVTAEKEQQQPSATLEGHVTGAMDDQALAAASLTELLGPELLKATRSGSGATQAVPTAETLNGKHVALFFSSSAIEEQLAKANQEAGGASVRSSTVVQQVYEKAKAAGHDFEVVYVPVQDSQEAIQEAVKDMPWYTVQNSNATAIDLIRKTGVSVLPSVVIVDPQGDVVTTDGYSNMAYFPDDFPWKNKNLKQLLGNDFRRADGSSVGPEALEGKVLGLYFSASWCAPCKQFTPLLTDTYKALQEAGKEFEIVYISSDKDEAEYSEYMGKMPWLAIPFESRNRAIVARLLGIQGLPTLLIFDENNKLISTNGRTDIIKDVQAGTPGANFPWHPKPLADLHTSPEALARGPVVLLFMDGVDKKEQARLLSIIKPIAEQRAEEFNAALEEGGKALLSAPRRIAFLSATEIDKLSGTIRKLCGLDEIQGKWKYMKTSKKEVMRPRLAVLSIIDGVYHLAEETLTEESVVNLLEQWDAGTLDLSTKLITPAGAEGEEDGSDDDEAAF